MVKKKVKSNSKTVKTLPAAKKKPANHAKKKSVSKIQKLENSGAQLLDVPIKQSSPALPNTNQSTASPQSAGTPNLNTATAEKILTSESRKNDPDWLRTVSIVLFGLIILFWVIVLLLSVKINLGPKMVEKNITLISYSPTKASFENLVTITDPNYNEEVTVLAYLREEKTKTETGESVTRYAVDDFGNKIRVVSLGYNDLFTANSRYTYNISGTYHNSLNGYVLDATKITQQNRELVEVKTSRLENVTEGGKAGIRLNLADGWRKISYLIGRD